MYSQVSAEFDDEVLHDMYEEINDLDEDELYLELVYQLHAVRHILSRLSINDVNVGTRDGDKLHFCCNTIVTGTKH